MACKTPKLTNPRKIIAKPFMRTADLSAKKDLKCKWIAKESTPIANTFILFSPGVKHRRHDDESRCDCSWIIGSVSSLVNDAAYTYLHTYPR